MDYNQVLRELSVQGGGIISTKAAESAGLSRAMLSKLYRKGRLHRIARGQYTLEDELADELLSLSLRTEQLVFSHETALFLQGISDRTPFLHSITVPTSCIPSPALREECKVYYVRPEFFDLGRETVQTPFGNPVPCYDLERTLCDILRSRNKIGTETFLAALKQYAANPRKNLNRLNQYAKKMNLTNLVSRYLEVLL
ncbi:MAG: type IV toxin-antitoxin system AbiEi family antitoxin domain-containing protein [Faecousia sp.]